MKGRKKEMTREEVHLALRKNLNLQQVQSEYGMTELLSQAYSKSGGIFEPAPWMKVLVRAADDPFDVQEQETISRPTSGGLNVIDLANIYSCSFLATDDVVRLHPTGKFEVLGRLDNSDIRGCGLMIL